MKLHVVKACLSLFVLQLAGPAFAQSGNPAGEAPGSQQAAPGVPAPHEPNQPDRVFVRAATVGGLAEVEFGNLAAGAAHSDLVKSFARRMVADHGKANRKLSSLAVADHVMAPSRLDLEYANMLAKLKTLNGPAFDHAYIASQLQDHQRTAQLLAYEIDSGEDAELKAFAAATLPIVLDHLQMAQDIATRLWGVAPQGAAPGVSMSKATP
jgi:putative membrane protein